MCVRAHVRVSVCMYLNYLQGTRCYILFCETRKKRKKRSRLLTEFAFSDVAFSLLFVQNSRDGMEFNLNILQALFLLHPL